jgi:hypothetical protein
MASEWLTRWLSALLGAGVVTFFAAFVPSPLQLFAGLDAPAAIEVAKPPPLAMREMAAASEFAEIEARPLFNEGRKADPAGRSAGGVQTAPQGAGGELSEYRLVGIVTDSVTQRAIMERGGGATTRVGPGDRLGGWRVEKIDSSGVTVRKDSQSVRIVMPKRSQP